MEHITTENRTVVPKLRSPARGVNTRYFKHLLQDRKLSQAKLAKLMDIHPSDISRGFAGKRQFTTRETTQLARILDVPLDDILTNLAVEVPTMRQGGMVSVVGEVIEKGAVRFGQPHGLKVVPVPPRETVVGLQALRYVAGGMLNGACLYYRVAHGVAPGAVGKLCVCTLSDGSVLLATLYPGTRAETYSLRDLHGETLRVDAWLSAASPVVWIKTA